MPTVVAVLLAVAPVFAAALATCDCGQREAPCSAYWTAPAIFVGRVDAIHRSAGGRSISFTVLERYRGVSSSHLTIAVGPAGQRCSLSFKVGREYLVYASPAESGGWTASACSRTRPIEEAASDLAYARAVKDGSAPSGQIAGQVVAARTPVPNVLVTVTAERDGVPQVATTNQAGDFTVPSRGPGRYRVGFTSPGGYTTDEEATVVNLSDARSCATIEHRLHYNGIVEGRVVTSTGQPLPGLTIELATAPSAVVARTMSDDRGRYQFVRVPPGRFVIGINLTARRTGTPRPRVFYPGVEKPTVARRVTVGPGARLTLDDFALPTHARYTAVVGVVFDPDGIPAEGARVYLKGAGEDEGILSEAAVSDRSGRFAIAAVTGASYRLFAEHARREGAANRIDSTDPAPIAVHEGLAPVRLTLRRRY